MITAVEIEDKKRKGLFSFIPFRTNKIRVEHLYCDRAAIKCVTYEKYRKEVNWGVLDRFIKAQRNHLLCREDLILPEEGYRRFESFELSGRMAENAALYALEHAERKDLYVAVLDDLGESVGLSRWLLDYSDRVTVITENTSLYLDEASLLLEEKGAVLRVTRSHAPLYDADLIISRAKITDPIEVKVDAVIFTSQKPSVELPCRVIYEYFFDLPEKFENIRPAFLEPMYFASALYTMANTYELGAELFRYCRDCSSVHTRSSVKDFFKTAR
ncbi:MAG: hypothetical protein IJJ15_08985 [Ruminococcus sp.]|nr:hypothetical protein [Ruminococcus sp.]